MTKTETKENCCASGDNQKGCSSDKECKNKENCNNEHCCDKNKENNYCDKNHSKDNCCKDAEKSAEAKLNKNEAEDKTKEADSPEKLKQDLTDLTDLLQRTQASFENYRKQTEKRVEDLRQAFSKEVLLKILPLVDNFDLAFKHNCSPADFQKGMELIYAQLMATLEEQKVAVLEAEGKKFDPHLHEALIKVDSELPAGTILEVFQRGFTLESKVLRLAKVKISSGIKPNKAESKEEKK